MHEVCVQALLKAHKDYFVVAAVREPEKMHAAAEKAGISRSDYAAAELQLASFQSAKPFRMISSSADVHGTTFLETLAGLLTAGLTGRVTVAGRAPPRRTRSPIGEWN